MSCKKQIINPQTGNNIALNGPTHIRLIEKGILDIHGEKIKHTLCCPLHKKSDMQMTESSCKSSCSPRTTCTEKKIKSCDDKGKDCFVNEQTHRGRCKDQSCDLSTSCSSSKKSIMLNNRVQAQKQYTPPAPHEKKNSFFGFW